MKPKAVLFDIDGTLLSLDVVMNIFNHCSRRMRAKRLDRRELMNKMVGYTLEESVPKLLPGVNFARFRRCFIGTSVRSFKRFGGLLPHVKQTIRFIHKKGIKIGIVTTKSRSEALAVLKGCRLECDVLVSGNDVKRRKPDPESVFKACKGLGVKPKDCMFVGDHRFDMRAATAAGCTPVGTLTGWGNRKNLKTAGAKYVIKDLSDLKKIIG